MEFTGITFLLYVLPICILGYYIFAFSKPIQNFWLLVTSLFLYAWGEPAFVLIMGASVIFNWLLGLLLHASENKSLLKKIIMIVGCIADIGLLGIVKYTNFIVDIVYDIFEWEKLTEVPQIALPIGISVFALQEISYLADVYRGDSKVQKNPFNLGLYISFFPQMFAGPIVRYNSFSVQLANRSVSASLFGEGCGRFAIGVIKKLFIANNLAVVADAVFDLASVDNAIVSVPVLMAWLGAAAFAMQFYYELSSLSDMAIGLAKMFGFTYQENFNYPFMAKSVTGFMSRWNLSLNDWLDRYVFKPLGGERVNSKDISIVGLVTMWMLSGLWYGASWNAIWWGLLIFALIVLEKLVMFDKWKDFSVGKHIYTIVTVLFLMAILRCENMSHFTQMALNMIGFNDNGMYCDTVGMLIKEYWPVFIPAIVFLFPIGERFAEKIEEKYALKAIFATICVIGLYGVTALNVWIERDDLKTELALIETPVGLSDVERYVTDVDMLLSVNPYFEELDNNIHSYANVILNKNESLGFEYVKDKNDYLYEGNFLNEPKMKSREVGLRIRKLEESLKEKNTKVIVLLYPSKYNDEWTKGYYGIPYKDYNEYEDEILEYFRYYSVEHIDFRKMYMEQELNVEDIYYKTDEHWHTQRAFEGFQILTEYLNTEHNAGLNEYYVNPDNYFWENHKEIFLGSYGKQVGVNHVGMDDYTLIMPKFPTMYNFTYSEENEQKSYFGYIENTLINREYLQSDDYNTNDLWNVYLNGSHKSDEIVNMLNGGGMSVLFISDSNTAPLATFFSSYCSSINMINPSLLEEDEKDIVMEDTIKAKDFDYIFIAMSVDSIATDGLDFYMDEGDE